MRDDAVVIGQRVAGPAGDDGLLARIADGLRLIAVGLAAVAVGRSNTRSKERHRHGHRTDSSGGVDAELPHVRPPCDVAVVVLRRHWTLEPPAGKTLVGAMQLPANLTRPLTGQPHLDRVV